MEGVESKVDRRKFVHLIIIPSPRMIKRVKTREVR